MSVKIYSSYAAGGGHPVLSGTAGALISLLDAVLINGYGLKTVDSIVVAGNVATVTINAGHSFELGSTALIAGATPAGLNGDKVVTYVSTTQIKFAAPGIADQTATGTITAKVSPLGQGWSKPFSGTNLAAYTLTAAGSFGGYLRLDDTGTTNARGYAYESMTDINTGVNQFPSTAQMASPGLYFPKSNTANATARNWMLFGDERGFYMWVEALNAGNGQMWFFGDLLPQNTSGADVYAMALAGFAADYTASGSVNGNDMSWSWGVTAGGVYLPRQANRQVSSINAYRCGAMHQQQGTQTASGGTSYLYVGNTFPGPHDNGVLITAVNVVHDGGIRGQFPGFYHFTQNMSGAGWPIPNRYRFATLDALPGRQGMAVSHAASTSAVGTLWGVTLLDVTGPWR
ncbi:hypothetical protein [Cupriavidus sp. BIC8F]|uniref:hypothetical protein n=1 Tax=Cupriavidus sp. BIC8F TaxID=3079014 RepID=UPI002916BEE1|nr:hypothetical protein [Cupriavidus sp. BIC8F]